MAKIDEPESLPATIDQQIQTDYAWSREPGQIYTDAEGKYLPPPMPEWRRRAVASHGNATAPADPWDDEHATAVPDSPVVEDDSHIEYDLDDERPWLADAWAAQTEAAANLANGTWPG